MSTTFTKRAPSERAARWEATGLRWLAASGAVAVVDVVELDGSILRLERLTGVAPQRAAAEAFGRDLAALHGAGAARFGSGPDGWDGDGYFGPNDDLLPLRLGAWERWGAYYAEACLSPMAELAIRRGGFPGDERSLVVRVCERLEAGEFDDGAPPARIHGDLWAGNVVWAADGATLIDPAAHGGHRESDLALLQLFGFPLLETVLGAYAEASPPADGWRERVALHQVHHLLVHCACFGSGYAAQTLAALRRYA